MQFFLTLFKRTLSNLGGPALRESDQSWIPPSRRLAHNGEKQDFSMEVVGSFQSCLERQINEAVRITSSQADFIRTANLNSTRRQLSELLPPMASKQSKEKTRVGLQLGTEVEVGGLLSGGRVEANSFHFYLSVF